MNAYVGKTQENKSQSIAHQISQRQNGGWSAFQFVDDRLDLYTWPVGIVDRPHHIFRFAKVAA